MNCWSSRLSLSESLLPSNWGPLSNIEESIFMEARGIRDGGVDELENNFGHKLQSGDKRHNSGAIKSSIKSLVGDCSTRILTKAVNPS